MQLGELQNQITRFERRGASILALSVDQPSDSLDMVDRLGLTYPLGSDSAQTVIQRYGVQNPDTNELALHAVYILDRDGQIFYRKVGLRRPVSNELIDAIDAYRGTYPQSDPAQPRRRSAVAYPQNNFQALITLADVIDLPADVDPAEFQQLVSQLREHPGDDGLILVRDWMRAQSLEEHTRLAVAARLTWTLYFGEDHPAIAAGRDLSARLARVRELEAALQAATSADEKDATLHTLARARGGLSLARGKIESNAEAWRLRSAKTSLRVYREVAKAAARSTK